MNSYQHTAMDSTTTEQKNDWAWYGLDHATAATLLAGHPLLAHQIRPEPFGEGDFCLAFSMGDQILRVAKHEEAAAALRRETCVLATIADKLPVAVPRPEYYHTGNYPPFSVHTKVNGTALLPETWAGMPEQRRKQLAGDIAAFLRALHAIPPSALHCDLPACNSEYISTLIKEAGTVLYPLLDSSVQQRIEATFAQWTDQRAPGLLHCDIAPGHLLYDETTSRLTGVIDFGDVAFGEPARDFIYLFEEYGSDLLEEVLRQYTDNDTSSLHCAIKAWYLAETIRWTMQMIAQQSSAESIQEGIDEIMRVLPVSLPCTAA